MIRLLKRYVKPFIVSIILAIILLFVQAQTELSLPDYMSDIVNTGIQTNGIENGVPNIIRQSEYEKISIFLDDNQIEIFENNYKLIDNKEDTEQYGSNINEPVYVLNTKNKEQIEQLDSILSLPETIVYMIENGTINQENIPENMDIYTMFQSMSQEELNQVKNKILEQVNLMGETSLNTTAASYIKSEYETLGVDINSIQNKFLFTSGLKMLSMSLLSGVCAVLVGFLASKIAAGLSRDLRLDVFTKIENFSSAEFNNFSTASLITRNTNDIQQIQMVIVMIIRIVMFAPIMGVGAMLRVIKSQSSMLWVIAVILLVIFLVILIIFKTVMPKFKIAQKLLDRLNMITREFLEGMPVIRAFNKTKYQEEKFRKANSDITNTNLFINRTMSLMMPSMMFIMNASALLVIWVGGQHIDAGNMQIGDIMAFIQYTMHIIMSFLMLSMVAIFLPRASVSANRIMEVLDCKVTITDPENPKTLNKKMEQGLVFDKVTFKYPGAEEPVLKDISFTAKPGQTVAFIGSTGSGKSTLINLIPRFYDVTEGKITIDNINIKDLKLKELRDKIGYVPQKATLFSGTIESNLKYANENATEEDLEKASQIAQALEFIETKPNKYKESISQGATNISGGQKQRLSIARALVKKPDIYILDDTFSALDYKTDSALRKALSKLCEETKATVLIVAQRITTIKNADTIIVLDEGQIAGIGTHRELIKNCKIYQEIAHSQLSKEEIENE